MKKIISALLFLTLCLQTNAQVSSIGQAKQDTLEVYFHQGYSTWDAEYKNNGKNLEAFVDRFKKLTEQDDLKKITKIHIVATCSPEGSYTFNERLAKNRAKSIRNILDTYISLPDSIIVERGIAINWEGLRKMVVADPDVPHKEEVLEIIDNSPELYIDSNGKRQELRKQRLIWRFDGEAWKYMYHKFFPDLRSFNLQIIVEWEKHLAYLPSARQLTTPLIQTSTMSDLRILGSPPPNKSS